MADEPATKALINVDLTKPLTVFIQKVSDAIGAATLPRRTIAQAKAEAQAAIIKVQAEVAADDIRDRARKRREVEDIGHQFNVETITAGAIPLLEDKMQPDKLDPDWMRHFFDQAQDISDEEMQSLWSRVLAGETNAPGSFSKRTVDFLKTLDKREAEWFSTLGRYVFWWNGWAILFRADGSDRVIAAACDGIDVFAHFGAIGLLRPTDNSIQRGRLIGSSVRYFDAEYKICGKKLAGPLDYWVGYQTFTLLGAQLLSIAGSTPDPNYPGVLSEALNKDPIFLSLEREIDFARATMEGGISQLDPENS